MLIGASKIHYKSPLRSVNFKMFSSFTYLNPLENGEAEYIAVKVRKRMRGDNNKAQGKVRPGI
jgi:hypothetical protein